MLRVLTPAEPAAWKAMGPNGGIVINGFVGAKFMNAGGNMGGNPPGNALMSFNGGKPKEGLVGSPKGA